MFEGRGLTADHFRSCILKVNFRGLKGPIAEPFETDTERESVQIVTDFPSSLAASSNLRNKPSEIQRTTAIVN